MKKMLEMLESMKAKQAEELADLKEEYQYSDEYGAQNGDSQEFYEVYDRLRGYLEAVEEMERFLQQAYPAFYFTFGTDPQYPYGQDDYVVVRAENLSNAVQKFRQKYPNRPRSSAVNCAFWYTQKQWDNGTSQYYAGREPADTIM